VHALRHVHRLLVPGGTLVDLHPVTEEQVESGGVAIGAIPDPGFAVDLPNAETRLRNAIADGLYVLETETDFDVLQHFDEADELIEAKWRHLEAAPQLVARIRSASTPLRIREHVVLRRLRAA
jgi:hypothetical protein